jgi:hypothetical protein
MHLSHLGRSLEMWRGRNQAVAFTAIMDSSFSFLIITDLVTRQVLHEW